MLTLREENRLNFFENTVPRRIFGLQKAKVTGERRRLRNEELYALYSSLYTIRMINEMDKTCSIYGGEKRCVQVFGWETSEETSLNIQA